MPTKQFSKLITRYLVKDMITFLNMLPPKNGISVNLSPLEIILGSPNPDYNKLNITFLIYAQVYIGTTNSTKQSTVGEIGIRQEK